MVTSAAIVPNEAIKERSISYQIGLWSIPVLTWILLIGVFVMASRSTPVKLIAVDNDAFLGNVQSFLESENVPYFLEGNAIMVDSREKEEILLELSEQEWFQLGVGPNRNEDRSLSRLNGNDSESRQLAWN